jgi:hypothetical protein
LGLVEEIGKPRKRRHSGRSKKEKLSLVPSMPSSASSPSKSKNLFSIFFQFSLPLSFSGILVTDL